MFGKFTDFVPPKKEDLVIYELLIRDFAEKANYQTLIDTIGYFKRLGINAIELMPTNEFEGMKVGVITHRFYLRLIRLMEQKISSRSLLMSVIKTGSPYLPILF
jgi:hypothetical protein